MPSFSTIFSRSTSITSNRVVCDWFWNAESVKTIRSEAAVNTEDGARRTLTTNAPLGAGTAGVHRIDRPKPEPDLSAKCFPVNDMTIGKPFAVIRHISVVVALAVPADASRAQTVDTAAVLVAAAREYVGSMVGRPVSDTLLGLVARDSASLKAARGVFVAAQRPVPRLVKVLPPCHEPLPRPANDTSPRGDAFELKLLSAAGDSAIVGVSLWCRYADRTFGRGEQLLVRRGPTGWRVERSLGSWIT